MALLCLTIMMMYRSDPALDGGKWGRFGRRPACILPNMRVFREDRLSKNGGKLPCREDTGASGGKSGKLCIRGKGAGLLLFSHARRPLICLPRSQGDIK